MATNTSKYQGVVSFDPASITSNTGANDLGTALGFGLEDRLARLNSASSTSVTPTGTGTREVYTPGTTYKSNDPLQGTIFESGAFLGLDPLGIFDVPQIQTDIERLDPQYLAQVVADQARRNAYASAGLEQELTPEVAQARTAAMQALLQDIQGGGTLGGDIESALMAALGGGTDVNMPELQQSELLNAAREQALADLGLGGELPPEIRNLVARTAAQKASGGGYLGGQIGRDIGARDLGLTALDLRNQRLSTAANLGAGQEATNIGQQGLAANIALQNRAFAQQNLMNVTSQLQNLRQQEFANRFGAAQFTQGIETPVAGLDPGDLASYIVGDVNQRNELVNQANVAQLNAEQSAKSGQNSLIGDVAGSLFGAFCWVAREVYGEDDERWMLFRQWLLGDAPEWFFKLYAQHGEQFADWLRANPWMKKPIKWWMNGRIKTIVQLARA